MATYLEIRQLYADQDLLNRTSVAVARAANAIGESTSESDARKFWACRALGNPDAEGSKALLAALAQSSTKEVSAIQSAPDSALQAVVDGVVDLLACGATSGF